MKNFFFCVMLALCTPVFLNSCGDDDETETNDQHNKSKTADVFASNVMANDTFISLYDIEVRYIVNGDTTTETVDMTTAKDDSITLLSGKSILMKSQIVSKTIKERPVKVIVMGVPKSNFSEILTSFNKEKITIAYYGSTINVDAVTQNSFSSANISANIQLAEGITVEKMKASEKLLNSISVE